MPNSVLNQLKALRDGVAQELRMDPRYRTLQALDKSIAEITTVLSSAGLLPAAPPQSSLTSRLSGLAPSLDALAEPAREASVTTTMEPSPPKASIASAPVSPPASHAYAPVTPASHDAPPLGNDAGPKPGFKDGTVGAPQPIVPEKKASIAKPALEIGAALLVAGGLAAEVMHQHAKQEPAKHAPAATEPKDEPGPKEAHAVDDDEAAEQDDHESDSPETHAESEDAAADDEQPAHHGAEPHAHAAHATANEAEDEPTEDGETEEPAEHSHAAAHADHDEEHTTTADGHAADVESDEEAEDVHEGALHALHDDAPAKHAAHASQRPHDDHEAHHDPDTHGEAVEHEAEEPGQEAAENERAENEPEAHQPDSHTAVIPKGKASGYVPMAAKEGAPKYAPSIAVKFGKLPNKVDLRPLMTPIEDQGNTSSCVANAVAGAYEYWIKKASKKDQNISRLFVYYNARWRDNSQDKDEGSVIQLAMEGLQKFGACSETVWPFNPAIILKKPGAEAYQDGAPYRVHDMAQVPLKLETWKQALAEGKPIIFGIELFDSFDSCTKRGGVVPMPAPDDLARKKHSGHSMCAVGYNESEKVFIIRNSWGADFGDKGYCYMPYDYILSPKFNDGDCWVFVPKVPSQPPRETWQDTTTPVTNGGQGVDFVIQPYTIKDYEVIAIDLFEHVRRPWNPVVVAEYSEYVSAVSKSLFSELESFDVRTFLASTAILAGVGVTAAYLSESSSASSSESFSSTSEETSLMSSESSSETSESSEDSASETDESEENEDTTDDAEETAEDAETEDAAQDADADDTDAEATDAETDAEGETAEGETAEDETAEETAEDASEEDASDEETSDDDEASDNEDAKDGATEAEADADEDDEASPDEEGEAAEDDEEAEDDEASDEEASDGEADEAEEGDDEEAGEDDAEESGDDDSGEAAEDDE